MLPIHPRTTLEKKADADCPDPPTHVLMDSLLLNPILLVRLTDRLAIGLSVALLTCTINRDWMRSVFLSTRSISRITSPCLLIGPLLLSHESEAECDAHVVELGWFR